MLFDTQPAGAEIFLLESQPKFLGLSGKAISLEPPAIHDKAGRLVQYASAEIEFKLAGHETRRITLKGSDWQQPRYPADTPIVLKPLSLSVWLSDRLNATSAVLALGLFVSMAGLLEVARRRWMDSRQDRAELESLREKSKLTGDPLLGKKLGGYTVESRLGQGGMGTVYGVRSDTGEFLAAKVFIADEKDLDNTARFKREARLVGQLHHPNLIQGYDFGQEGSLLYYVMEYVDGQVLSYHIRPGGLSWPDTWKLAEPIIDGLAYAHQQGIVHRDLKPANIMLTATGVLKILDFGLARERKGAAITQTGKALGTPTYFAPEQLDARSTDVETRSDQYSFAIILFELLTGVPPFKSDEPEKLVAMHMTQTPPLLRSLRPDLPRALEQIIARSLEKDPKWRFPSMEAMKEALVRSATRSGDQETEELPEFRPLPPAEPDRSGPTVDLRTPKAPSKNHD